MEAAGWRKAGKWGGERSGEGRKEGACERVEGFFALLRSPPPPVSSEGVLKDDAGERARRARRTFEKVALLLRRERRMWAPAFCGSGGLQRPGGAVRGQRLAFGWGVCVCVSRPGVCLGTHSGAPKGEDWCAAGTFSLPFLPRLQLCKSLACSSLSLLISLDFLDGGGEIVLGPLNPPPSLPSRLGSDLGLCAKGPGGFAWRLGGSPAN